MDIPDAVLGKLILGSTTAVFTVLVFWVNTYPFIDEELPVYSVTPDPQWLLLCCAACGLLFVGGLMAYTYYHIREHL